MNTATTRRGSNLTPALRRQGGLAAAAKLTPEQRRAGGQARAAQPSFVDHQRERGRKGAATTLARYGARTLVAVLAAWRVKNPTDLDRFVSAELDALGVPYRYQQLIEIQPDVLYWALDFVLPGAGPGGCDLVIEPGHRRWHGTPTETLDGCDHQAQDAARYAHLAGCGFPYILTLSDTEIHHLPTLTRQRIRDFVAPATAAPLPIAA